MSLGIERIEVHTEVIPTGSVESDGTLRWDATTAVICAIEAGGRWGVGYTYASRAAATVIEDTLSGCLLEHDAFQVTAAWMRMRQAVRNLGEPGIAAMALSAADIALWDLLACHLNQPLHRLLGAFADAVPCYGSGGFTSYTSAEMHAEIESWMSRGVRAVKIKVGREPDRDVARVRAVRELIGDGVTLYVDANGAYARRQALELGEAFAALGVTWYEEPVTADDPDGLAWLRDRCPPGLRIASGEYGYRVDDFKRLLDRGAVDVLMADATRCGGVTGFMRVAALASAYHVPLSSHCAPTLHRSLACAVPEFVTAECFLDHLRTERRLFEGAATIEDGKLAVDPRRAGLGIRYVGSGRSRSMHES